MTGAEVSATKGKFASLLAKRPSFAGPNASAFRDGMIGGLILFVFLVGWMAIRANDTAWKLQDRLPFRTTAIEEADTPATQSAEEQPGLQGMKDVAALPPAPAEGLFELYQGKQIPIVRMQDDLTAFHAYKKPFSAVAGRPMVSIVIVDYGLSESLSKSMLDNLPADISFALSPYADEPAKWAAASRAYGHEFWLMLPMQSREIDNNDTGPLTLLVNAPEEQNRDRLFRLMGTAAGYAGFVSQQNHAFGPNVTAGDALIKQIFGRGLALVESNPDVPAFGYTVAREDRYPYAQGTIWLDSDLRPDAIDRKLGELELQATRGGKAVAFLHPYPAVINKLQDWLKGAEEKGIQIAPLSALTE